ncbi:MAG: hypothetical protein JW795_16305 [Chitinivibrionales bacterium]|nr:hypothetical protein [Chitinivibrionales bacterium]
MNERKNGQVHPVTRGYTIYKVVRNCALLCLLAIIIKLLFCDTVSVRSDHMKPTVQSGDRVVYSPLSRNPVLGWFIPISYNSVVLFKYPMQPHKKGILRIGGCSGDTVMITNGILQITNKPQIAITASTGDTQELVPPQYSPRDNLTRLAIPSKGDTITLETSDIRNAIFLYSIIQQENPKSSYELQPMLYINDSLTNKYIITDFSLYTGAFDAVPDSLKYNWFFWDRLKTFLLTTNKNKIIFLTFLIYHNKSPIVNYVVRDNCYFCISDNWQSGYDSRFFGPLSSRSIAGRSWFVLWSNVAGKPLFQRFEPQRIGRIIK